MLQASIIITQVPRWSIYTRLDPIRSRRHAMSGISVIIHMINVIMVTGIIKLLGLKSYPYATTNTGGGSNLFLFYLKYFLEKYFLH